MKRGQAAFIVLPDTNPRNIYEGTYEFDKKFEIVEVIIEEVRNKEEYTHYRLKLVDETQRERLIGPIARRDGSSEFGWESSIASTKEELKKMVVDEVKPMVDGWATLFNNLEKCFNDPGVKQ